MNKKTVTTSLTLGLTTFVAAVVIYMIVGAQDSSIVDDQVMAAGASLSPDQSSIPAQESTRSPSNGSPSNGKAAPVGSLVTGLEHRLAENPDDGKGWLLLAKSYDHLGDRDRAASAYEKAVELGFHETALDDLSLANKNQ